MVDTDNTQQMLEDGNGWQTIDVRQKTTPGIWHKLPTGDLKRLIRQKN